MVRFGIWDYQLTQRPTLVYFYIVNNSGLQVCQVKIEEHPTQSDHCLSR